MNVLDIILGIPLIYAAWRGFREGTVLQLAGIIGLLIGIWLAFRYGTAMGNWLRLEDNIATIVGFLFVVVLVMIGMAILGRLSRGLFQFTGLGLFDQVGGIVLSVLKMGLLLSILLIVFEGLNRTKHWVSEEKIEKSFLYTPIRKVSDFVFPYLKQVQELLLEEDRNLITEISDHFTNETEPVED